MKGLKQLKTAGICLLLGMSLLACQEKKTVAPELLDPIESKDAVHTVTKENFETQTFLRGEVVPARESMRLDYNTQAWDIQVKVGDEVTLGQELMKLDSGLAASIAELKIELEVREKSYQMLERNQEEQVEALREQVKSLKAAGNQYMAGLIEINIRELAFQFEFQNGSEREAIEEMRERLASMEASAEKNAVVAPCDGKIVYLTVTEHQTEISAYQTFLVIAREDKLQIACPYVEEEKIGESSEVVTVLDGKEYELTVIPYTDKELFDLKNSGQDFLSYFECPELDGAVAYGDFAPIYVRKTEQDVLTVPTDSIYRQNGLYYVNVDRDGVYVATEVTLGTKTHNTCVVTSGLAVGDVVFVAKNLENYSANSKTVTAQTGEFIKQGRLTGAVRSASYLASLHNVVPGVIKELHISNISEVIVTKGQPLYTVTADISDVQIEQAKLDLKNEEKAYADRLKQYEEKIERQTEALAEIENTLEKDLASIRLNQLKEEYESYQENAAASIEALKEKISNWQQWKGTDVCVTAEFDCVVESFSSLKVGDQIGADAYICNLLDLDSFIITVKDDGKLRYGQQLTYSTRLNGNSVDADGAVLFSKAVSAGSTYRNTATIVLHDSEIYKTCGNTGTLYFVDMKVQNAVTVPANAVRTIPNSGGIHGELAGEEALSAVWVYDENHCAVLRYVTVAETAEEQCWIVDGLAAGDVVILP